MDASGNPLIALQKEEVEALADTLTGAMRGLRLVCCMPMSMTAMRE